MDWNQAALVDNLVELEPFAIKKKIAIGVDRCIGKFEQASASREAKNFLCSSMSACRSYVYDWIQ
jgi:hypothetical protein